MEEKAYYTITEKWNFESFKEANGILQKKFDKSSGLATLIAGLVTLFSLVAAAYIFVAYHHVSMTCLICVFVGLFLLALFPLFNFMKIKAGWKILTNGQDFEETVSFYEEYFKKENNKNSTTVEYDKINRVEEMGDYVFFFISKTGAYMIQKDACSKELLDFVHKKMN